MLKQLSEFSKVIDYKVNILKSIVFTCTSNKKTGKYSKNNTIYNNKKMTKYLKINVIKTHYLY